MENTRRRLLATSVLMMATGAGSAGGSASLGVTPGPTPAPTAPPASNPPTPVTPTPTAAPTAAAGSRDALMVKNNTARAIHIAGVMLVPGTVTPLPNDKDGVNKRDAESVEGLEILSAAAAKKAGLSARGEANMLEVGDVLHPDNSGTTAATADPSGPTLYKPPEQIVKDATASGWVNPGKK